MRKPPVDPVDAGRRALSLVLLAERSDPVSGPEYNRDAEATFDLALRGVGVPGAPVDDPEVLVYALVQLVRTAMGIEKVPPGPDRVRVLQALALGLAGES